MKNGRRNLILLIAIALLLVSVAGLSRDIVEYISEKNTENAITGYAIAEGSWFDRVVDAVASGFETEPSYSFRHG